MLKQTLFRVAIGLLALVAGTPAQAGYNSRDAELRKTIQGLPFKVEAKRLLLNVALEAYLSERSKCMDELVSDEGKDQSGWESRVASTIKALSDLRTAWPSDDALEVLAALTLSLGPETEFLANLQQLKVAASRAEIQAFKKKLIEQVGINATKWSSVSSQDDSIDDQERRATEDVNRAVDDAINRTSVQLRDVSDKVRNYVYLYAKTPKTPTGRPFIDGLNDVVSYFGDFLGGWINAKDKLRGDALRSLLESERGGVWVLFNQARSDTESFMRSNDFSALKSSFEKTRDAVNAFAGKGTDGQRGDAAGFARDVLAKLSTQMDTTQYIYNGFVDNNQGKFFGPIAPGISDSLLEARNWDNASSEIGRRDLTTFLSEWRSNADRFWGIDTSSLNDGEKAQLTKLVSEKLMVLWDEMKNDDALRRSLLDEYNRRRSTQLR